MALRPVEVAGREQQAPRAKLRVDIPRRELRRAHVRGKGSAHVANLGVGARTLVVQVGARLRLDRVAVFDHRFLPLPVRGVAVGARLEAARIRGRIVAACADTECEHEQGRRAAAMPNHGTSRVRWGTSAAAKASASARALPGSLATGAMMRTRAPSVRCSRAASSINHNLLAYSLAMVWPRPWYQ